MKITNNGNDSREYPTLGVILEAGKSYDETTAKIAPVKEIPASASSDITVEEVN